jgi:hypothetical protein
MKEHWVVIDYNGTASLVTLSETVPGKFYWGGSMSWCTADPLVILYDYGYHSEGSTAIDELELDFYQSFNLPTAAAPHRSAGWISPDGLFYPCGYAEHDGAAKSLAAVHYNSLEGVRELERRDWLRLDERGYLRNYDRGVTQKQMDTLWKIHSAPVDPDMDNEFGQIILDYIRVMKVKEE